MPDMKVLDFDGDGVGISPLNDSVYGVEALAQTVALMLLDPNYGNLEALLKKRINNSDIGEIILKAVDNVERQLLDEQSGKIIPLSETLISVDVQSIVISNSSATISIKVSNSANEESVVTI